MNEYLSHKHGDGRRVKSVITNNLGSTTTYFIGAHYEVVHTDTGTQVNKYYFAGSQRIAMRKDGVLYYILGDQLGSTSIVTDASGNVVSETRYKAWGEVRYTFGSEMTKYQYTGQYSHQLEFGLLFYNARWYDPYLNHMTQPDSIVPDPYNSQDYDRYAYVRNNPIRYTDPSGHFTCSSDKNSDDYCPNHSSLGGGSGNGNGGKIENNNADDFYSFDDWIWDNVPSAIGFHGGASGQIGAGIEPGFTIAEFLLLFNWRSGEISFYYSYEGFVYAGTPSVLGGNVYVGVTTVEGLSRNQFYEGSSYFGGVTGAIDVFKKLGVTLIGGRSITAESAASGDIPPNLFIDPISERPIEYHQSSITYGGNIAGNGFDIGLLGGGAYTMNITSYQIPFWP